MLKQQNRNCKKGQKINEVYFFRKFLAMFKLSPCSAISVPPTWAHIESHVLHLSEMWNEVKTIFSRSDVLSSARDVPRIFSPLLAQNLFFHFFFVGSVSKSWLLIHRYCTKSCSTRFDFSIPLLLWVKS